MTKYGLFVDGELLEQFDTPEEAYEEALFSYQQTEIFHEVKEVN